jgi:acetyl esterase/lipase
MYRPQTADFALENISLLSAIEYGNPDGSTLCMDLIFDGKAQAPMPVILWIHGGGFTEEECTRLSRPEQRFVELARRGYCIASIDYRLAQEKPFPSQIQDSKCAVRFLRSHAGQFKIDPDHIGVWGESCGGQLAALMAVEKGIAGYEDCGGWEGVSSKIQAAVAWYGGFDTLRFTNLLKDEKFALIYGGTLDEKRDTVIQGSPITYVAEKLCPLLAMCSDADIRVPFDQGIAFCQAAREHGNTAQAITVPNQGHGYFEGDTYYEAIYQFFDRYLKN